MRIPLFSGLWLFALSFVPLSQGGLAGLLSSKARDWAFIQSVGGMRVKLDNRRLEIDCDVSGTKTVTVKPSLINSGIGVRKVKSSRAGKTLRLTVVTCVMERGMKSECGQLDLSAYPAGSYDVVYLDPGGGTHPLAAIRLP